MIPRMRNPDRALTRLDEIKAELEPLEKQRDKLRKEASELVIVALKAKKPPTEVADRSPFSHAHVRTLARLAGLPPAKRSKAVPKTPVE